MNQHRGTDFATAMYDDYGCELLPEPPDNLEFLELFTPEQQEQIDTRFQVGIEKNRNALREAALRRERSERMTQARKERRAIAREAFLASRFNPVLRSRP